MFCIAQKYMSLMMKPEDKITVMRVQGTSLVDTKTMDAATYTTPVSKQGVLVIHVYNV